MGEIAMRWIFVLLVLLLLSFSAAQGQRQKADSWAWDQIRAGTGADFNARCGQLDPTKVKGWFDDCRKIPADFLRIVLTDTEVPHHLVLIRGAHIIGGVAASGPPSWRMAWLATERVPSGPVSSTERGQG